MFDAAKNRLANLKARTRLLAALFLLDAVLAVYKEHGINNDPENCVPLKKIDHELAWSYPEYRIVVTKKVSTCENLCELFYELLKDKMPIKKITYRSSSMNAASKEFK